MDPDEALALLRYDALRKDQIVRGRDIKLDGEKEDKERRKEIMRIAGSKNKRGDR